MIFHIRLTVLMCLFSSTIQSQNFETNWVTCRTGCVLQDPYFLEGVTFTWNGKCTKGKADGEGTAVKHENGQLHSTYKGHYEGGIRKGFGKMIRHISNEYWEGIFSNGQLTGPGKHLAIKQQLYYEGDFYNYYKQGRGNQYYNDGSYFTGIMNLFSPFFGIITDTKGNKVPVYDNSLPAIFISFDMLRGMNRTQQTKKFYSREWEEVPESRARFVREYKTSIPEAPVDTIINEHISGGKESVYIRLRDTAMVSRSIGRAYKASWYHRNENLRASCYLDPNGILTGPFLMFHENGILASETYFDRGLSIQYMADFYPDGAPKRIFYAGNGTDYPETILEIDGDGNGYVVYEHDFFKNKAHWSISELGAKSYVSIENKLMLDVPDNAAKFRGIRLPADLTSDFTIECTVGKAEGNSPKGYGLVFGHANWENHFQFLLSGIGSFFVFGRKNDKDFNIINWKYGKTIRKENQSNDLRITKKGNQFHYFINQFKVGTSEAYTLPGQAIGLIAAGKGTYTMQNLKIKEHLSPQKLAAKLSELYTIKAGIN